MKEIKLPLSKNKIREQILKEVTSPFKFKVKFMKSLQDHPNII
jgi:hypothetical protein